MQEDLKADLEDSLELLKLDRYKQGRDYSTATIQDIENCLLALNDLSEDEENLPKMKEIAHEVVQALLHKNL